MAGTFKDIGGQLLHGFMSYRPKRMNEPHICEAISQEGFVVIVQD